MSKAIRKQLMRRRLTSPTEYFKKLHPHGKPVPYFKGSELKKLEELPRQLYKKISEIYGIPANEITPRIEGIQSFGSGGGYSQFKHSISAERGSMEHEQLHSLQRLLMPAHVMLEPDYYERHRVINKNKKIWGRIIKELRQVVPVFSELKDYPSRIRFEEGTASVKNSTLKKISKGIIPFTSLGLVTDTLSTALLFSFLPVPAATAILGVRYANRSRNILRINLAQNYFRKYGPEALLLLYASPPKNFELLKLREHERFLVKEGLLDERGLTKKGMRHIRHMIPRAEIIRRLQSLNKSANK